MVLVDNLYCSFVFINNLSQELVSGIDLHNDRVNYINYPDCRFRDGKMVSGGDMESGCKFNSPYDAYNAFYWLDEPFTCGVFEDFAEIIEVWNGQETATTAAAEVLNGAIVVTMDC